MTQQATFNQILDLIDTLSQDEREDSINIVRLNSPFSEANATINNILLPNV
ncbi:hypothetical protein VB715_20155 [Crocosphaera sp. UHCC 0190]|uniref:hypothetical protein n=1 Tax=Crocosphaera sp. UHCC 0190 TaxID=3110246 RepID=UPI002B1EC06B|nr:hypothetical protein [Crocosphaera sp. UHCC 0190]MEA5512091.1 hypothetical protein [Crocosphaera sp. UHCC 0190]